MHDGLPLQIFVCSRCISTENVNVEWPLKFAIAEYSVNTVH